MSRQTTGLLQVAPEDSNGLLLTPPTPNDWSDWEEFIASTAEETVIAGFNMPNTDATADLLAWNQVQVGIGADGVEVPIATYLMRWLNVDTGPKLFFFDPPMEPVPAGTRVAMRIRSDSNSGLDYQFRLLYFTGFDSDHQLGTTTNPLTCIPLPDAVSVTPTCQVTPNAVAWQWSEWAELAAAGAFAPEIALVALVVDSSTGTGPHDVEFEFGIGASGSEAPISRLRAVSASGAQRPLNTIPFPVLYPLEGPSPRMVVRLRKSTTTTNVWTVGLRLYANVADVPVTPPQPTPDVQVVRRLRRSAHLSEELFWLFITRLQIDLEAGVGLASGQGSDPQLMLRISRDGGFTWDAERWTSVGALGDYSTRALFYQLGRGRDLVIEITVSDPVFWAIFDAFIDGRKGTS